MPFVRQVSCAHVSGDERVKAKSDQDLTLSFQQLSQILAQEIEYPCRLLAQKVHLGIAWKESGFTFHLGIGSKEEEDKIHKTDNGKENSMQHPSVTWKPHSVMEKIYQRWANHTKFKMFSSEKNATVSKTLEFPKLDWKSHENTCL
ncbi:hypothetical protein Y1Q_0015625 [Alligator mississippiensis]|uniref:Uncharacterized protein n=1 Tax=Alligator mississippiensis TaxID=8496 RepID=A0A151NNF3_ALLMI|nr:hypothetical protein Y1Q_0015625 [Alligator mississippiensis]